MILALQPLCADAAKATQPVEWLDDRGQALPAEEVFEVCWIRGLERQCAQFPGHSLPEELPAFDILQIESPGHGPFSAKAQELRDTAGYRARVPRKGWLQVRNPPNEAALTLSLYPQRDPESPRPVLKLTVAVDEALRIPAGAFIASLSTPGAAPHLTLLDLDPGERYEIVYRKHPGWSLVLRASEQQTAAPVAGTQVAVTPAPGYSETHTGKQDLKEAETGDFGLAVFNGLREPILEATLEHPGFLPVHLSGLSSTRGTFAYRDVPLPKGGSATISVLLEGKPVLDADCVLLRYPRHTPQSQAPPEQVFRAASDEKGQCRATSLREGTYWLRVHPPERLTTDRDSRSAHVQRILQVHEGQESLEEVTLRRTQVEGTVRLGDEPAPAFEVVVQDPDNRARNSSSKDAIVTARTDGDGHYAMTLWAAGTHWLFVYNQKGVPGALKQVDMNGGTETVDFQLAAEEIRGRVLDEDGRPVEKANVQLKWNRFNHRLAITDENGLFSFPVEGEGKAEIMAHKDRYRSSEAVTVEVRNGLALQPVVLTLSRRPEIAARLLAHNGNPVLDGWAATYRLEVHEPVLVGTAKPGPGGIFWLPVVPGRAHRLFFAGTHCPLGARSLERLPDPGAPLEIVCAPAPAHLQVTLKTPEGAPREGHALLLAQGKVVFPREVVTSHLGRLGLPATTNGAGNLSLVALEPGEYRLYLADVTSPFNVLVGAPDGFLTTATLTPWSSRALEVRLDIDIPRH